METNCWLSTNFGRLVESCMCYRLRVKPQSVYVLLWGSVWNLLLGHFLFNGILFPLVLLLLFLLPTQDTSHIIYHTGSLNCISLFESQRKAEVGEKQLRSLMLSDPCLFQWLQGWCMHTDACIRVCRVWHENIWFYGWSSENKSEYRFAVLWLAAFL